MADITAPNAKNPKENTSFATQMADFRRIEKEVPQLQNKRRKIQQKSSRMEILKKENVLLRQEIGVLKRRLRKVLKSPEIIRRRHIIPKRKQRNLRIVAESIIENMNLQSASKAIISLQLHVANTPYTEEEKKVAKQLYYHSPAALKSLRKAGANFPGVNSIRRWLEEYQITPGFCESILKQIGDSLEKLPANERVCALKFDETAIKSYEEYTEKFDLIEGLVDLGKFGRLPQRAHSVLVLCIDSINAIKPWHQPFAYFFLPKSGVKAEDLMDIISLQV